jgi:hypothetical protein
MRTRVSRRRLLRQATRLAATAPFLGLAACALDEPPERAAVWTGPTMGTAYRVTVPAARRTRPARPLHADVREVLARVDGRMSTYRPDAELARFNGAACTDWVDVSAETLAVVELALEVTRRSGGAFDPTVGPLVDLWGFGPAPRTGRPPTPEAIAALLPTVGGGLVETRRDPPQLRKRRPEVRLDLSGIAKGHALDQVAARLDDRGVASYLVDVGELRPTAAQPEALAHRDRAAGAGRTRAPLHAHARRRVRRDVATTPVLRGGRALLPPRGPRRRSRSRTPWPPSRSWQPLAEADAWATARWCSDPTTAWRSRGSAACRAADVAHGRAPAAATPAFDRRAL